MRWFDLKVQDLTRKGSTMFEKIWERLKKLLAKQIKKDIEEVSFVKVEEPESQQNSKDKAASSIDKTAKHLSTGLKD